MSPMEQVMELQPVGALMDMGMVYAFCMGFEGPAVSINSRLMTAVSEVAAHKSALRRSDYLAHIRTPKQRSNKSSALMKQEMTAVKSYSRCKFRCTDITELNEDK